MAPFSKVDQNAMRWSSNRQDFSYVYRNLFLVLTLLFYASIPHSTTAFEFRSTRHSSLAVASKSISLKFPSKALKWSRNLRETYRKGSDDDQPAVNDYFQQLGYKRIVKGKQDSKAQDTSSLDSKLKYFIPGFVAFWAIGYSVLFLAETSGTGLGDVGGFIGAGLVVVLVIALVGTLISEVFRPQSAGNSSF